MEIEELTRANHDEVVSLILAGLADHWGELDERLNADLGDMLFSYADGSTVAVRRDYNTPLVGTGTVVPEPQGCARIVRMAVAAEARRAGVGRRVVDELLAIARDWGVGRVVLETSSDWLASVAFYQACGFTITHTETGDFGEDTCFERRI